MLEQTSVDNSNNNNLEKTLIEKDNENENGW